MTEQFTIYVSSGGFGQSCPGAMSRIARDWGVQRIEMTAGLAPMDDPLGALQSEPGLDFLLHNYFPTPSRPFVLNLASEDAETRTRSLAHCEKALRMSAALGAQVFSVHAGFAAHVRPEHLGRRIPAECLTDRATALNIFHDSIGALIPVAQACGVRLCVENNVVAPQNLVAGENKMLLLATAGELLEFKRAMNSQWVGLLVDVGHVNVTCKSLGLDRRAFLAEVAPHTDMLHLSDNDGTADTNGAFGPGAWFIPHLPRFSCDIAVIEAYGLTRTRLETCLSALGVSHEPV